MYLISWARRNCLPSIGCFPGPRLIFLRFTSFSKAGVESSSHGTIHEAFRRVAALCIPLLRSNRHQRLLERIVPPRASGSFLSPDPRSSNPEQGSAQPAYQLLSELGGSFCQEPPHSHRVGPKRCPQRGSGPALVAPNAQEGLLWRLFHFQEHGTRANLPDQRAEVSYQRPQPPDPGASAQPLTHYYFYIYDQVLGPIVMRVASFLPFQATYYLNGHSFIEQELNRSKVAFRKN